MKKVSIRIFLLIFLCGILLACNSIGIDKPIGSIEITDSTGHTIMLENLPQRITIAGKASNMVQNTVFLFEEANERVIALEKRNQSALNFLVVVDPTIDERGMLEKNAGPEQIAATNPDLVILKNYMVEQLGGQLDNIGIPVLYLDLETPEAFYRDISTLGQVFGVPERAYEIIHFYKQREERVESMIAGLEDEQRPNVLLLEYSDIGGDIAFHVPPASWLQTMMVELAGGKPIWIDTKLGKGWTVVSMEQIAAWDPDQIFIVDYRGRASEVVQELIMDPLWNYLTAVQYDQVYAFGFDFYSWDQPDSRWVLGLQWLATKIHPKLAEEIDILAEVGSFYSFLYSMDDETIQADVLPIVTGDIP